MKTRELVLCGLFAALVAASAWVKIPLPFTAVPLTLQVFVVLLAGAVLGARLGAISLVVYVLLGAVGVPVFAGGGAGLAYLLGPTGGYVLGFVLAALIVGLVADRQPPESSSIWARAANGGAMLVGIIAIYFVGLVRLKLVSGMPWDKAFLAGVLPFIGFDVAKAVVAVLVAPRLKRALMSSRAAGTVTADSGI